MDTLCMIQSRKFLLLLISFGLCLCHWSTVQFYDSFSSSSASIAYLFLYSLDNINNKWETLKKIADEII